MLTEEGEKTKLPPGATVTSNVVALAAVGKPISEKAVATNNIGRQEDIFIAWVNSANQRRESAVYTSQAAISQR